jgi:carboxypeptidase Q
MKVRFLAFILFFAASNCMAQDSLMFRHISDEIMLHGTCYDNLRVLCKSVGHRLSGSPEAAKAVSWGQKTMQQTGADKVWLQPADVPHWVRGKESLHLKYGKKGTYRDVTMLSLGNSQGTNGKVLEAPVIMVHNFDEFSNLTTEEVKGKIVFFNYRFRQDIINTFAGYGDAVKYRGAGASVAAEKGAVGVIIRSISTGEDDVPHTGALHYTDSTKEIPAVAIGNISADTLEVKCAAGTVTAQLQSSCRMLPEYVRSYNVIGEITGSEHPEHIITVGGHLDSWDVGEGANDDGAGAVQSMEVLRVFKALGIKPKCTIRAVLFMNEENGDRGGMAYADSAKAKAEDHIFAIESDAGGDSPRGIGFVMSNAKKEQITYFKNLFLPYGVYDFSQAESGTDIEPLGKLGVPMAGLLPDPQRYFDIHHSNNDVFERISNRELKLGAVTMAQLIYLVSEYGLR